MNTKELLKLYGWKDPDVQFKDGGVVFKAGGSHVTIPNKNIDSSHITVNLPDNVFHRTNIGPNGEVSNNGFKGTGFGIRGSGLRPVNIPKPTYEMGTGEPWGW